MSTAEAICPAPSADLGDRIARLAAEATVREHQLIRAIGDFEASGQWATEGAISCAQWLSWRIGMSAVASRERVRVAKALAELPKIDAAFAEARLSYSKVRALTRVANADNEAELLEIGLAATATQCERICRTFRKVMAPGTGAEVEAKRRVSVREGDDGTVRVSVVLPADEGARFLASMDAAREVLDRDAPRGDEGGRHSRADGLMAVVEGWFSAEMRPRRGGAPNEVVLHVSADALRRSDVPAGTSAGGGGESTATESVSTPGRLRAQVELPPASGQAGARRAKAREVPAGTPARTCGCTAPARGGARRESDTAPPTPPVPAGTLAGRGGRAEHGAPAGRGFAYVDNLGGVGVDHETARRLACDASLVTIVEGTNGEVLDVGRKRRTVPPAITRALEARHSRRCAFPGCEHTLFLDHHHIEHWADGGETKVDNLMLLCRHHHTFVHEHGWTIELGPGEPTFVAPSGSRMEAAPQLGPVDVVTLQDHLPGGRRSARSARPAGGRPWTTHRSSTRSRRRRFAARGGRHACSSAGVARDGRDGARADGDLRPGVPAGTWRAPAPWLRTDAVLCLGSPQAARGAPEIITSLAQETVRGARPSEAATHPRAPESLASMRLRQ